MKHMISGGNIALCVGRAGQVVDQGEWNIVFCSRFMSEFNLFRRGGNVVFPLLLPPDPFATQTAFATSPEAKSNLSPRFLNQLRARLGFEVRPKDVFSYAYAILHSPGYRSRYAEFLKIDFPRLPMVGDSELFHALVRLGSQLTALHLLESPKLGRSITDRVGEPSPIVEKISWSKNAVWLDKAQTNGFEGIPRLCGTFTSAATRFVRSGSRTAGAAPFLTMTSLTTRRSSSPFPKRSASWARSMRSSTPTADGPVPSGATSNTPPSSPNHCAESRKPVTARKKRELEKKSMKADTLDLQAVFYKPIRYRVPMFQRPYVWTKERQWEPTLGGYAGPCRTPARRITTQRRYPALPRRLRARAGAPAPHQAREPERDRRPAATHHHPDPHLGGAPGRRGARCGRRGGAAG